MRRFIDLHLKPSGSKKMTSLMIESAIKLGFKGVALSLNSQIPLELKEFRENEEIDLISRIDLKPENSKQLKASLRNSRRNFEIVAVKCLTKDVARQAAKDNRVDVLNFPESINKRRKTFFDRREANLASDSNCAYEINLINLLRLEPFLLSKFLSILKKEVENAMNYDVPIIVSSGADSPLYMREPRGLASISTLLDMGELDGLNSVSSIPITIVETNRKKLCNELVFPGVWLV